jgi:glucokinase
MKKNFVALGIDIGGTEIKYGLVLKEKGQYFLVNYGKVKTPKQNISSVVEIIFEIYNRLKTVCPKIVSVVIGIAGLVDSKKGIVIFSPNLKWANVKLKDILSTKIVEPIFIDNDANLATFGIYKYELKGQYDTVVCFTLGTGVGGGIIINKKLFNGSNGLAGELGHTTIIPNGKKCNCGNKGCLERYVGGQWFIKTAIEKIKQNKKSLILSLAGNKIKNITPQTIFLAAQKNDFVAKKLWQEYGKYLGIAVANVINTINPEIIIFTGGIANANRYFISSLKSEVENRVFPIKNKKGFNLSAVKFHICSNPQNFGILGAGIYGIESI